MPRSRAAPYGLGMTTESFIAALPKVELHLHLVGAAPIELVRQLATRYPDRGVPADPERLARFYRYQDFPHFAEVHEAVNGLIRTPEDLADLVRAVARRLAEQNVRYAELTVTPYGRELHGIDARTLGETLDEVTPLAIEESGVELAYIFDIWGDQGVPAIRSTLEAALEHPPASLVGLGLAGTEQGRAPYDREFAEAFASARAAGLHSVPHAGEMTGAETIWTVLRNLEPERIGHAISCLEDPELVAELVRRQLPLEVAPTSNVCTGQVPSIEAHPFDRMRRAGLYVTLNSDDPPMFDTDLENEYRLVARNFGLDRAELAELSRRAVRAAFMPEPLEKSVLAEIDQVLAAYE